MKQECINKDEDLESSSPSDQRQSSTSENNNGTGDTPDPVLLPPPLHQLYEAGDRTGAAGALMANYIQLLGGLQQQHQQQQQQKQEQDQTNVDDNAAAAASVFTQLIPTSNIQDNQSSPSKDMKVCIVLLLFII